MPLSYLNLSAQAASVGRPPNFTFYLISIANSASMIGRLASGFLADKFGPLNVLIPFTFAAGIASYIWPYVAADARSIIVISIIYGCATGAFVSLLPSAPIRLGRMEDAGSRCASHADACLVPCPDPSYRVGTATSCIVWGYPVSPLNLLTRCHSCLVRRPARRLPVCFRPSLGGSLTLACMRVPSSCLAACFLRSRDVLHWDNGREIFEDSCV